jgi:hypothetical protein
MISIFLKLLLLFILGLSFSGLRLAELSPSAAVPGCV